VFDPTRALIATGYVLRIPGSRVQGRTFLRRRGRREIAIHKIVEERLAQTVDGIVSPSAVERIEDPDIFLGQQVELGVKEQAVAAMSDHGALVSRFVEEAVRHRAESWQ